MSTHRVRLSAFILARLSLSFSLSLSLWCVYVRVSFSKALILGSWHDSLLASELTQFLQTEELHDVPRGYKIAGDSAFNMSRGLDRWIVKPYVFLLRFQSHCAHFGPLRLSFTPTRLKSFEYENRGPAKRFSRIVSSIRVAAEWGVRYFHPPPRSLLPPSPPLSISLVIDICIRAYKGAWGRFRLPLHRRDDRRKAIFIVTTRLHNLRARRVGISQIRKYYAPKWKYKYDEELDTKKRKRKLIALDCEDDRVSRFYFGN
jgi:hypothetical protein